LAKVLASIKVFPADVSVSLEGLKSEIKSHLPAETSVYKFEEEPVAFGLVALIAHILLPEEKSGAMDEIEQALKSMKNISEIQVLMVRRV